MYRPFVLTPEQEALAMDFLREENVKAIEIQKTSSINIESDIFKECWAMGQPYGGAVGGLLTFSFTATSLGAIVEVTYNITKARKNLTDFSSW